MARARAYHYSTERRAVLNFDACRQPALRWLRFWDLGGMIPDIVAQNEDFAWVDLKVQARARTTIGMGPQCPALFARELPMDTAHGLDAVDVAPCPTEWTCPLRDMGDEDPLF